jgi:hypothetical protein
MDQPIRIEDGQADNTTDLELIRSASAIGPLGKSGNACGAA